MRDEKKIYNLISKRFLSLFMEDAIVENKNIKAICEDLSFSARGSEIKKKSWLSIYPSTTNIEIGVQMQAAELSKQLRQKRRQALMRRRSSIRRSLRKEKQG